MILFTLLLVGLGFLLSVWIVVPAPKFFLLPLAIAMPEISPMLFVINILILALTILKAKVGVYLAIVSLYLSLIPIWQFPRTNQEWEKAMLNNLGPDYLSEIPDELQKKMRLKPLVLLDLWMGIKNELVEINRGIEFAQFDAVSLKLNTYFPKISATKLPVLVVIYGGAWRSGSPEAHEAFSCYFANQGYGVISIDYRHAPQYRFPTQLKDIKTALWYIRNNQGQLNLDLERVALIGRSAGAHLATLVTLDSPIPIKALVNYYGPIDLLRGYQELPVPDPINVRKILKDFLGGTPEDLPDLYLEASPMTYVKAQFPPSLFVHPRRDHLVKVEFSREFVEGLRSRGNLSVWGEIPWAEHGFDYLWRGMGSQLALYYVERFLAWSLKQ